MKRILRPEDVKSIDIELSNICNLKCPLCLSQLKQFTSSFPKKFIDFNLLKDRLSLFRNLEVVSIAGDASEPTLYPNIIELLDYLKDRPNIKTELYTNATTHNEKWWKELNKHFSYNSIVYFTICGSTQELHSKYRVGSNLETVLRNAKAFRIDNPYKNDYMQYIKFEYNKTDNINRIMDILSQFSSWGFTETDPVFERFFGNKSCDGVCSEKIFSFRYKCKLDSIKNDNNRKIKCYSYESKYIRMDNYGIISPCVCYRLYKQQDFLGGDIMDYTSIYNNKYDFCLECDTRMREFLDKANRDAFFMC